VLIYRPDGDIDGSATALAPPVRNLAGARVAVLDNGKPNAVVAMKRIAETVAAETGATLALVVKKGPGGRSANAAIPCAPDVMERLRAEADVVITGAADCGSCTAYSVHDTIELERAGIPTVLLTTTRFAPIAVTLAADSGLAEIRTLVLEHPVGGIDAATLEARAEASASVVAGLLTGTTGGAAVAPAPAPARSSAPGDGLNRALAELRDLVGADGAGLDVVAHDPASGALRLRLVIPDAHCAECVMPRAMLESAASSRLRALGIVHVTVEDPREAA
jgi:hypothetical protein